MFPKQDFYFTLKSINPKLISTHPSIFLPINLENFHEMFLQLLFCEKLKLLLQSKTSKCLTEGKRDAGSNISFSVAIYRINVVTDLLKLLELVLHLKNIFTYVSTHCE